MGHQGSRSLWFLTNSNSLCIKRSPHLPTFSLLLPQSSLSQTMATSFYLLGQKCWNQFLGVFLLSSLHNIWYLSSPTRDWNWAPTVKVLSPNHWTLGMPPKHWNNSWFFCFFPPHPMQSCQLHLKDMCVCVCVCVCVYPLLDGQFCEVESVIILFTTRPPACNP